MSEQFVSEPIQPVAASYDTSRMAIGEPGVPGEFMWCGKTWQVKKVVRSWRKMGPCTHGSGELYVRRHYYEVETESGEIIKLYFDRNPIKGKSKTPRWWLFSITTNNK